jgi:hypothetical protein
MFATIGSRPARARNSRHVTGNIWQVLAANRNSQVYVGNGNVAIGTSDTVFTNGGGLIIHNPTFPRLRFTNSTTGTGVGVGTNFYLNGGDWIVENNYAPGAIKFSTGGVGLISLKIDANRNVMIGQNSANVGASAVKVLGQQAGTAPTTAPSGIAQMWVENINGAGSKAGFHMMAESGTGKIVVGGWLIKTDTGDPSQVHEGLGVINTFDNTAKIYADGGWRTIASW